MGFLNFSVCLILVVSTQAFALGKPAGCPQFEADRDWHRFVDLVAKKIDVKVARGKSARASVVQGKRFISSGQIIVNRNAGEVFNVFSNPFNITAYEPSVKAVEVPRSVQMERIDGSLYPVLYVKGAFFDENWKGSLGYKVLESAVDERGRSYSGIFVIFWHQKSRTLFKAEYRIYPLNETQSRIEHYEYFDMRKTPEHMYWFVVWSKSDLKSDLKDAMKKEMAMVGGLLSSR